MNKFDVIVVGGGHAGIEAAHAATKLGSKTLLITLDKTKIGSMPCNPSIGGVGKGHMVFEISALGGLMPKLCSKTYLQARMLNTSRGLAVQGLRLQIDREAYAKYSQKKLSELNNLTIIEAKVNTVLQDQNKQVIGVKANEKEYFASAVVLTTGTFLNGVIHMGSENQKAGRRGEGAVTELAEWLKLTGLKTARLKTGTPPRIKTETVDFSELEKQDMQDLNYLYEFNPIKVEQKLPCYITRTNPNAHKVIKDNLHQSPMYCGNITGKAPRYCPSIEDKIHRFPDKEGHQVFIEPETADYKEIYPAGISTSMPKEVQEDFIHSIKGFENAEITKYGYAVEYDYICPTQLKHTLEIKSIPGLFLAGQINGTTGYEEAASQGLIAGVNAHNKVNNKEDFILSRQESYIGVMIDDLVTLGADEPYRMFTSRAERRILLRQDNVFKRLSPKGYQIGMLSDKEYEPIKKENEQVEKVIQKIRSTKNNTYWLKLFGENNINIEVIQKEFGLDISLRAIQQVYAEVKYNEYLKREEKEVEKANKYKDLIIPANFDYKELPGLSKELQEKLFKYRPATIAQAMLIPGITPAAISLLIFNLKMKRSST